MAHLSLVAPMDSDLRHNVELEKLLVDAGLYESKEEEAKRLVVLGRINQDRVENVERSSGTSFGLMIFDCKGLGQAGDKAKDVVLNKVGGGRKCCNFTFGSYRLGIERDTNGLLWCHPYPKEYTDTSKLVPHSAFFMGLHKAEGVKSVKGHKFDINGTINEFKQDIKERYKHFWEHGMETFISHISRKQLPAFVFPEGYRRSRGPRHMTNQLGSTVKRNKRKNYDMEMDKRQDKLEKRASSSPQSSVFEAGSSRKLGDQGPVKPSGSN
ncbi:hypothetical protein ACFE04_013083 [Oxalis oulophora]